MDTTNWYAASPNVSNAILNRINCLFTMYRGSRKPQESLPIHLAEQTLVRSQDHRPLPPRGSTVCHCMHFDCAFLFIWCGRPWIALFVLTHAPLLHSFHSTRKKTWDNSIASSLPEVAYKDVMESDKGLAEWLNNIVSARDSAIAVEVRGQSG